MEREPSGIQARLLHRPFDKANPRPLDSRVASQPWGLLAGAQGILVFQADRFRWTPSHLHRHFKLIDVPWTEVMRGQLVAPGDFMGKLAMLGSRDPNGYVRFFLWHGLVEFSFVLPDGAAVHEALNQYLDPGQMELGFS